MDAFLLTGTDCEEINIVQIRDNGTRFNINVVKKREVKETLDTDDTACLFK
jgi:hypothetical protein